jgi:mRNA interferase HigB
VDVRKTYPHADAVGELTIFNIGGNKYRLATRSTIKPAEFILAT